MDREIILKMLLTEGKIPADVIEVLGIEPNQKSLITLYSDRTITIEPAPTLKTAKPTVEPVSNVKLIKAKPKRVNPMRVKPTIPVIPADWVQIGKNAWLTKEGEVNRLAKGRLNQLMSAGKVLQVAELIRGVPSRSEAIKTLMNKRNFSKNTATTYYGMAVRAMPHLEKMELFSRKEKSVPMAESPEAGKQENREQAA